MHFSDGLRPALTLGAAASCKFRPGVAGVRSSGTVRRAEGFRPGPGSAWPDL